MSLLELFEESISVLKNNKLRTGLSILGIVIGISAVISLITLGQASQANVRNRIQSLGSNLLIIRAGTSGQGFIRESAGSSKTLTYKDFEAIKESDRITTIDTLTAEYNAQTQVSYGRNNENVSVSAVTPEYFDIRNIKLTVGNIISISDMEMLNRVVILGATTTTSLFGENFNPVGQIIKLNGTPFTVIGVTEAKGSNGRTSMDEIVYIPLTTALKGIYGADNVNTIYVKAKDEKQMTAAQNQLGFFLMERHRISKVEEADFSISSQADLLETINEVTKTFTMLLTGIAAISLVVGGIGIMNIMLVTVTERTSEIGIRKALGAKRKAIITQFLVEAVILTFTGGLVGVLVGVSVSYILTKVMSLPFVMSYQAIFLSFAVACAIGIIFGWYPAQRAAKLQPIEALRYE
jgi:putative ABC transport system permease protein